MRIAATDGSAPVFMVDKDGHVILSETDVQRIAKAVWAEMQKAADEALKDMRSADNHGPCICELNQEAILCPRHGQQAANRPACGLCGTVLGFCPQGEYCTNENCGYAQ